MKRRTILITAAAAAIMAAVGLRAPGATQARPLVIPTPPFAPRDAPVAPAQVVAGARPTAGRFEYLLADGEIDVYREGSAELVQRVIVPATKDGTRGLGVDVRRHLLYISYGGDGGNNGTGSLLAYDLLTDRVLWQKDYPIGIDSFALTPDGNTLFMPGGEGEAAPWWYVIRPATGEVVDRIDGGSYPHNTAVSLDGKYAFLGPRGDSWLTVVNAHTYKVIRRIGPLRESERPFTVNGRNTLAFTTASLHRGFQVSSIRTGKVLYTRDFGAVPASFPLSAPSHGISLSPDEKEVWVIDEPADSVQVWGVSRLPARGPRRVAVLPIADVTGEEEGCGYDCFRSGWVQHTLDDKYVYIGDSGNVFATHPARPVATIPALRNTRKHVEIDWRRGIPVGTSTREGLGHVTR